MEEKSITNKYLENGGGICLEGKASTVRHIQKLEGGNEGFAAVSYSEGKRLRPQKLRKDWDVVWISLPFFFYIKYAYPPLRYDAPMVPGTFILRNGGHRCLTCRNNSNNELLRALDQENSFML